MPLNDPIGSSAFDVLQRNAQDIDRVVNNTSGTVTNRTGTQITPIPAIVAGVQNAANAAVAAVDIAADNALDEINTAAQQIPDAIKLIGGDWQFRTDINTIPQAGLVAGNRATDLDSGQQFIWAFYEGTSVGFWSPITPSYGAPSHQNLPGRNGPSRHLASDIDMGGGRNLNDEFALQNNYFSISGHAQMLAQKLKFGKSANVIVLSDSTGDAQDEWVYRTAELLAQDYPAHTVWVRPWDTITNGYTPPVVIQTGSSGAVLVVWNAAISGSIPTRFMGSDLNAAVRPGVLTEDPDLIFINYGHNGGQDQNIQYSMMSGLVNAVQEVNPLTPIIIIGQNPVVNDDTMTAKVKLFKQIAAQRGCGFIDVHALFVDQLKPLSNFYVDDVHPNAAGSNAWASLVHKAVKYNLQQFDLHSVRGSAAYHVISVLDTFKGMTKGAATNLVTLERDGSIFESAGESLKITATGSGVAFMVIDVVDSNDITKYRNKDVSVKVRCRAASGSGLMTGRVSLFDGTTTISTLNGGPHGNAWYDQVISMKVGGSATSLKVYVYADGAGDVVLVDRIITSFGIEAGDGQSVRDLDLRSLSVIGNSPQPVQVIRNSLNAEGTVILETDSGGGSDNDNPETEYVISVSSDGIKVKQRGDAFSRFHVRKDGTVSIGSGATLASQYLFSPTDGSLRFVADDFSPAFDSVTDLGSNGLYYDKSYVRNMVSKPITAASAEINSLFIDSADGNVKFKDASGVVKLLVNA